MTEKEIKREMKKFHNDLKKVSFGPIVTFLTNLNGKAGTSAPCPLQRTSVGDRCCISLSELKKNGLFNMGFINRCNEHSLFDGGCYIMIDNGELEDLIKLEESEESEESRYLLDNLGGDKNISSLILITSEKGVSGSSKARDFYERVAKPYIEKKGLIPLSRRPDAKEMPGSISRGNEKIIGHYIVNLCGGSNQSVCIPQTKSEKGKTKAEYQIFNPSHDYCPKDMRYDRDCKFLYLLLHAADIYDVMEESKVNDLRSLLKKHLQSRDYEDGNLYDKTIAYKYGEKKVEFIIDGVLTCPLTTKVITLREFKNEEDPIQLCHEESVAHRRIYYDSKMNRICTAARPNNLFLGFKLGNMQQQNMTINEYHNYIIELSKKFQ